MQLNQTRQMQISQIGLLVHLLNQAARMQKMPLGQALEERANRPFPGNQAPVVQA